MSFPLPESAPICTLSALPTGRFHLPDRWLFEDGDSNTHTARQWSPDFSFLITHQPSGRKIMFDLGMRKNMSSWPQVLQDCCDEMSPEVPKDVVDLLAEGGLSPNDIDTVVLSHLHFDHVGDVALFPNSKILVGPGSKAFTSPGYPADPKSPFFTDVLQHPHLHELSFPPHSSLGPFARSLDLFGDGSLFLLDTPGHMPGHIAALIHTGRDEWVFTGGDCCHHRSILRGRRPISVTMGPNGTKSFHFEPEVAKQTIEKVALLEKDERILVALPHDATLDAFMPLFPKVLNGWRGSQWVTELKRYVDELYPPEKQKGRMRVRVRRESKL